MEKMRRARGVKQVSGSVLHLGAKQRGRAGGGGLLFFVCSFRAKNKATAQKKINHNQKKQHQAIKSSCLDVSATVIFAAKVNYVAVHKPSCHC